MDEQRAKLLDEFYQAFKAWEKASEETTLEHIEKWGAMKEIQAKIQLLENGGTHESN